MLDFIHEKYGKLQTILREMGSTAVAFSGGVDSAFLLAAAQETLHDRVIAVTAQSCSFPQRELTAAKEFCAARGIRHILCESEELALEGFRQNPVNRCYICKHALFEKLLAIAAAHGMAYTAEGSNTDDPGDYRPGLQAIAELGIRSPLREAGLSKAEIRQLSREIGLPTWDKPSFACLASRFPYGETISAEKLSMVERAEQYLLDAGFTQVRVRIHGSIARIELLPDEFPKVLAVRESIVQALRGYGFSYISLDLQGYRTGSMNETISTT